MSYKIKLILGLYDKISLMVIATFKQSQIFI